MLAFLPCASPSPATVIRRERLRIPLSQKRWQTSEALLTRSANGYSVCYVGHSMGGAVGVLRTAADERIQALVSLAGMVHTKAFAEREFGDVTPDAGFMWDEPDCPLSQAYVDDMAIYRECRKRRASKFAVPWLVGSRH